MKMAGVKMNVMQFGARKADGASELPMPKAARARFQADVNTMGALFVRTVARNRKISAGTITGFDGATFMGANAVRAGLSDQVAAPAEAFALVKAAGARRREQALNSMRRR
jgi:ClpP class serine protease